MQTYSNANGTAENHPVILQLGTNPTLLKIRARVLGLTGIPVECTADLASVDSLLDRYTHGLLVLCHSMPTTERIEVVQKVRQRRPGFKHLFVADEGTHFGPEESQAESVYVQQGPRGLLSKADELLETKSQVRFRSGQPV